MQQKVVVVVLPSPYKPVPCWRCKALLSTLGPFCDKCQSLQDLPPSGVSYFSIFGLPVALELTEESIRQRFYDLSKKTHPDRFSNVPAPESLYALRWSTLINKAYQILRDRQLRSLYLLELFQIPPLKTTHVPVELAESYFELQDLIMDEEEKEGVQKMQAFKENLINQIHLIDAEWQDIATEWEKAQDKEPILQKLGSHLNKQSYLNSMLADLDRRLGKSSHDHWN